MSTVQHHLIENTSPPWVDHISIRLHPRTNYGLQWMVLLFSVLLFSPTFSWANEPATVNQEKLLATITEYAQAVAKNDRVAAGQRDFVCLLKMAKQQLLVDGNFPDALSPIYEWCDKRRTDAHAQLLNHQDIGLDNVSPGPGKLVNFKDFQRFYIAETSSKQLAPSFFVMHEIARHEPEHPFTIQAVESGTLPHASWPSPDESAVHAAPTNFVITTVSYPNALTAPVSNGPGTTDWEVPYRKFQRVIQSVKVKWVVLSDLKRLGFPTDHAVLDIPLDGPHGTTIPFVIDAGGFVPHSTIWFGPEDQTEVALAGVKQALAASNPLDTLMQLNRILMIAPKNQQVLRVFANQLYHGLLNYGGRLNGITIDDPRLAQRFNELYWTVISQTDRFDLGIEMVSSGKTEPTPGDYLYRMIPVMETLASLEPGDFQNRRHLISTYRWNNDQQAALSAPQELLAEVTPEQVEFRAEVLLELAWARIGKVAWNRHFDDPDIRKGYEEAKQALELTKDPLNKFTATYAMAYSLAFHIPRDNQAMLDLLHQAKEWYQKIPGASPQGWAYMLENDTLKGLVNTDPAFKSLLLAAR